MTSLLDVLKLKCQEGASLEISRKCLDPGPEDSRAGQRSGTGPRRRQGMESIKP